MTETNKNAALVGTWILRSTVKYDADGNRQPPNPGWDNPIGYLIYTPEDRMIAFLASGNRDAIGYPDIDDAARIHAHKSMAAYTGTYEFKDDHVLHHVDICWIPDWQGGTQRRDVKLEGDRLVLMTPFGRRPDGSMSRFEVVWERV